MAAYALVEVDAARSSSGTRTDVGYVTVAYVLLTAPQAVDFFRLLPVLGMLALAALHLSIRWSLPWLLVRPPVIAVLLITWLGLTGLWSDNHTITLIQSVSTSLVVFVGVFAALKATRRSILNGIVLGGVVILALSIATAVVSPSTGLTPEVDHAGSLRGLYVHRNLLAEALSPAIVAAAVVALLGRAGRLRNALVLVILLGGLALTQSSTAVAAVMVALIMCAVVWLVRLAPIRWRLLPLVVGFGALTILGAVVAVDPSVALGLLARDSTFSGRAIIWAAVQKLIAVQPVGGYGWGAPWVPGSTVYSFVQTSVKFDVPSAHSGYLDAWLQSGAVGLALFIALLISLFLRGLIGVLRQQVAFDTWLIVFSTLLIVYNFAESTLISPLSIFLVCCSVVAGGPYGAGSADQLRRSDSNL